MVYILKPAAKFEPEELLNLLQERPHLLHPRIRFLQGPFPVQNLGRLDLLGLDDQGGWIVVKVAEEGNGELLLETLHQVAWVQDHSSFVQTLPSYSVADAESAPTVFIVSAHFSNSLADALRYLKDVTVGLVKVTSFDMGEQRGVHFEPLFEGGISWDSEAVPATEEVPLPDNSDEMGRATPEPNLSLLQPLTDEEIAEFLPANAKEENN